MMMQNLGAEWLEGPTLPLPLKEKFWETIQVDAVSHPGCGPAGDLAVMCGGEG